MQVQIDIQGSMDLPASTPGERYNR